MWAMTYDDGVDGPNMVKSKIAWISDVWHRRRVASVGVISDPKYSNMKFPNKLRFYVWQPMVLNLCQTMMLFIC